VAAASVGQVEALVIAFGIGASALSRSSSSPRCRPPSGELLSRRSTATSSIGSSGLAPQYRIGPLRQRLLDD